MKVIVLYHPLSDHGGLVADYAAEFERYKKKTLDLVSLESIEGADLAELYGITHYPAILVMTDAGSLQRMWQGTPLPLMDELTYYVEETHQSISRFGRRVLAPLPA
jgi:hypothetical protein